MVHCVYELCYILIISIFNFLIFIHFTNQITLKPSLAQKLKLLFKFSTIMEQINVPLCQSKEQQRIAKWKQVVNSGLGKSKKQKTVVWLNFFTKYFLLLVSQGRMKEKLMSLKLLFDISFLISKTVFFQNHWVFLISNMRWRAVFIIRKWAWGPGS